MLSKLFFALTLAVVFCCSFGDIAQCPPGALLNPNDPSNCYLFSSKETYYYDADDYCVQAGGHLVSVHNAIESDFFRGAVSSSGADSFWIGASNNNLNGTWKWEDNSTFDWTDWGGGQPNGTIGLCLYMRSHDGLWFGDGCVQNKTFMCRVNPVKQGLAGCPNGWSLFSETEKCYKVLKNIANNSCDYASQQCANLNANLVSVHSFRENSFISGMANCKNGYCWSIIGLIGDKGLWRWKDNSPLDYARWNQNTAPQVTNGSCIVVQDFANSQQWVTVSDTPVKVTEIVCEINGYESSWKATHDSACPNGTIESPNDISICYKIYSDASSWNDAEQYCQKENGNLVSIHDTTDNTFLLGAMEVNVPGVVDFWTGGFYNTTWKWIDGKPFNFTNWALGNPQFASGLCMSEKVRSGYWYSTKCDEKKTFYLHCTYI